MRNGQNGDVRAGDSSCSHAGGAVGGLAVLRARLASLRNRSLNMFTLIALGVGAAYALQRGGHAGRRAFPAGSRTWRQTRDLL
jgi:hypothetical protein